MSIVLPADEFALGTPACDRELAEEVEEIIATIFRLFNVARAHQRARQSLAVPSIRGDKLLAYLFERGHLDDAIELALHKMVVAEGLLEAHVWYPRPGNDYCRYPRSGSDDSRQDYPENWLRHPIISRHWRDARQDTYQAMVQEVRERVDWSTLDPHCPLHVEQLRLYLTKAGRKYWEQRGGAKGKRKAGRPPRSKKMLRELLKFIDSQEALTPKPVIKEIMKRWNARHPQWRIQTDSNYRDMRQAARDLYDAEN